MFKASVPGNLVLMGEHAVLHDYPALGLAINKRMHLCLVPRRDKLITISSALGVYETDLDRLTVCPPFEFLLCSLANYRSRLTSGCDMVIDSDFAADLGLGSSACISLLVHALLSRWLQFDEAPMQLYERALKTVRQVQGRGSGLDLMTSLIGGLVQFTPGQPGLRLNVSAQFHHWLAVYCGYKTPTAQVLARVAQRFQAQPSLEAELYRAMGAVVQDAHQALQEDDSQRLALCMDIYQGLLNALGVSDARLEAICDALRQDSRQLAAKISGSGLGDCVISLGSARLKALTLGAQSLQAFPLELDLQGLIYE